MMLASFNLLRNKKQQVLSKKGFPMVRVPSTSTKNPQRRSSVRLPAQNQARIGTNFFSDEFASAKEKRKLIQEILQIAKVASLDWNVTEESDSGAVEIAYQHALIIARSPERKLDKKYLDSLQKAYLEYEEVSRRGKASTVVCVPLPSRQIVGKTRPKIHQPEIEKFSVFQIGTILSCTGRKIQIHGLRKTKEINLQRESHYQIVRSLLELLAQTGKESKKPESVVMNGVELRAEKAKEFLGLWALIAYFEAAQHFLQTEGQLEKVRQSLGKKELRRYDKELEKLEQSLNRLEELAHVPSVKKLWQGMSVSSLSRKFRRANRTFRRSARKQKHVLGQMLYTVDLGILKYPVLLSSELAAQKQKLAQHKKHFSWSQHSGFVLGPLIDSPSSTLDAKHSLKLGYMDFESTTGRSHIMQLLSLLAKQEAKAAKVVVNGQEIPGKNAVELLAKMAVKTYLELGERYIEIDDQVRLKIGEFYRSHRCGSESQVHALKGKLNPLREEAHALRGELGGLAPVIDLPVIQKVLGGKNQRSLERSISSLKCHERNPDKLKEKLEQMFRAKRPAALGEKLDAYRSLVDKNKKLRSLSRSVQENEEQEEGISNHEKDLGKLSEKEPTLLERATKQFVELDQENKNTWNMLAQVCDKVDLERVFGDKTDLHLSWAFESTSKKAAYRTSNAGKWLQKAIRFALEVAKTEWSHAEKIRKFVLFVNDPPLHNLVSNKNDRQFVQTVSRALSEALSESGQFALQLDAALGFQMVTEDYNQSALSEKVIHHFNKMNDADREKAIEKIARVFLGVGFERVIKAYAPFLQTENIAKWNVLLKKYEKKIQSYWQMPKNQALGEDRRGPLQGYSNMVYVPFQRRIGDYAKLWEDLSGDVTVEYQDAIRLTRLKVAAMASEVNRNHG